MPRSSATTMYIASSVDAVALIVIDVDTLSSGISSSSVCMSSTVSIATPTRPDFAQRARRIRIDAHLRRQIERDAQPRLPGGEQQPEPPFVSAAVPNPAYCRMVHRRPRYMVGCTPRVNGNLPGSPRSRE